MHLVYPTIFYRTTFPIDLFSLYVLFSLSDHVMVYPRELFLSNVVLCTCIHVHMHAYIMKRQKANSLDNITWSELENKT